MLGQVCLGGLAPVADHLVVVAKVPASAGDEPGCQGNVRDVSLSVNPLALLNIELGCLPLAIHR